MARILRYLFSPDQFQPHPSLWAMNHSTISNPEGLQAQTSAPHHRHSSGVSASRHGAGHSRSCHPGRSRWDPPAAPHTCRRQSNEGASIFHVLLLQQRPQCPLRLFDHHTVGEDWKGKGREGKTRREEERKGSKRRWKKNKGKGRSKVGVDEKVCGEGEWEDGTWNNNFLFKIESFLLHICFIYLMEHQKEAQTGNTENII